ncbi:hypothetical protein MMC20_002071 [Loxospora ochrophaea]|nr:hypothetical protein [Loxospora ochrophaea]
MSQPLAPLTPSGQNLQTPATVERRSNYKSSSFESEKYTVQHSFHDDFEDETSNLLSSPFIADIDAENDSPIKDQSLTKRVSPKKQSPHKQQTIPLTEHALRENEGLTRIMKIAEHTTMPIHDPANDTSSTTGGPGFDDTCLSTFSAVPNVDMTNFAKLTQSPKSHTRHNESPSPRRTKDPTTPITNTKSAPYPPPTSPTPRRPAKPSTDLDDSTNLILDFTEQFNANIAPQPYSPTKTPSLRSYKSSLRSPQKQHTTTLSNLLDFDLPAAPTPRSVPSISAREVEALKSSYLSQISSLRATLSGKDAEVSSLKDAINNAEQRVCDALEEARNDREAAEGLRTEREEWEKRHKEMQAVLRGVKEEIWTGEKEKEELVRVAEESEKKLAEAENRVAEVESRLAGLEAGQQSSAAAVEAQKTATDGVNVNGVKATSTPRSGGTNKEVEVAVEKVARELHGLYKKKHEDKVAALKGSYAARWEKKVRELEKKLEEAGRENEELRSARDGTLSRVIVPEGQQQQVEGEREAGGGSEKEQEDKNKRDEEMRELQEQLNGLVQEMDSMKGATGRLEQELEQERKEKGELVAAVEEMLLIQSTATASSGEAAQQQASAASSSNPPNFRGSVSRASGLKKAPGSFGGAGESRIGGLKARSVSGTMGLKSGGSGIMSSIERMGMGRGGGRVMDA